MNILHISGDYPFTSVYRDLARHIDEAVDGPISQTIYSPLARGASGFRLDLRERSYGGVDVVYSAPFRSVDRYLYRRKRFLTTRDVLSRLEVESFDLIHGHFLFTAGGVAQRLSNRMGIPYVASVRNTDVNFFFRRAVHLRRLGVRLMRDACAIVFISPKHQHEVLTKYVPAADRAELEAKTTVIPNGIDHFWLQPRAKRVLGLEQRAPHVAFIGEFTSNKNVTAVVQALEELRERGCPATACFVGDGPMGEWLKAEAQRLGGITVLPWTNDREELLARYREADVFVMPSYRETFGLSYLEAMSQGVPVIYSRGQGIDGYFRDGEVGFRVDPGNVDEIADAIQLVLADDGGLSERAQSVAAGFAWPRVAERYLSLYGAAGVGGSTGSS